MSLSCVHLFADPGSHPITVMEFSSEQYHRVLRVDQHLSHGGQTRVSGLRIIGRSRPDLLSDKLLSSSARSTACRRVRHRCKGLWNARYGAGVLIRIDPEGENDRVLKVSTRNPTTCVFGGRDLKTLFITSARLGLESPSPADSALLQIEVDVPGMEPNRFTCQKL